jgi:hypothetical protein
MKIDLSFIPEEILTEKIKKLKDLEFEYPYTDEDKFSPNFIKSKRTHFEDLPDVDIRLQKRQNYKKLEKALLDLACKQKKAGNLEIAVEIFRFLVEIGSKYAKPKEELARLYAKTGNKRCLKWICNKIRTQLSSDKIVEENTKLEKFRKKFRAELNKPKKRGRKKKQ